MGDLEGRCQMSTLIAVEDAIAKVLESVRETPVEEVFVIDAIGRAVAEDLHSDIDINMFDDAAMDGYAIIGADVADASEDNPVELDVIDVVGAGYLHEGTLESGKAVKIMTGAAMPAGADTNVKIEDVEITGNGDTGDKVIFHAPYKVGANVRKAGEEAKAGQLVFEKGSVINPAGAGLLATTGHVQVPVHKRPVVGIISIGSELVDSTEVPPMGKRRDSNKYTLASMARDAGAEVRLYPIAADKFEEIRDEYTKAAAECDLVVSSGGACGGDFDYITQVITSLAEVKFEYVNMKPGKAQTFGVASDGTLLFGLSGNPAASATGFEILIRPALLKMQGHRNLVRPRVIARLDSNVKRKQDSRRFLLRGTVTRGDDGVYVASPSSRQSSAIIGTTSTSNCFIVIPEGTEPGTEGMEVECIRIDMPEGSEI